MEAPQDPGTAIPFEVDEGRWMNLDVSLDAQGIVFDLLGNLYTLPIAGGESRPLLRGPGVDVQPRHSPDGRYIAFTSDCGAGSENLWIIERNRTDPRQLSNEYFRLVNEPAWTPDGQFITVRKHFTSTRSLGAGEVWMYHVCGSTGLQLTKRKLISRIRAMTLHSARMDVMCYFSEDVGGGSTIQYNKDPHKQIYVIRRLGRKTGDLTNLITGSGGHESSRDSEGAIGRLFQERGYILRLPFTQIAKGHSIRCFHRVRQNAFPENGSGASAWVDCLSSEVTTDRRFVSLES